MGDKTFQFLPTWTDIQKWFELGQVITSPRFCSLTTQSGISLTVFVVFVSIVQS